MAAERANGIHRLKVTLKGTKPPVWRRVLIPSSATLADLHPLIQAAMGWWDVHLHEFRIDGVTFGFDDGEGPEPPKDEAKAMLGKVAPEGSRFVYEYDLGDGWEHQIDVEEVLAAEPDTTYPCCIAGRRECPPEDVGGPWGYTDFLDALADPDDERHDELLEWVGGSFDPDHFDLDEVNDRITGGGFGVFDLP